MNAKITGFILSSTPLKYLPQINPGLYTTTITGKWGYLVLYGTSEDMCPVKKGVWSLGFPAGGSLLEHNLIISLLEDKVNIENDWLGSVPVYFNREERIVSTYPEVCLKENVELDDEGLFLFFKYGFSVFGRTPFASVRSLRYYSSLIFSDEGLSVDEKPDPLKTEGIPDNADEDAILNELGECINQTIEKVNGSVVSPLSGGLDSRLINSLIEEKYKPLVHTYSYGFSKRQEKNFESVIGRETAFRLGLKWAHIPLRSAYQKIDQWHDLFGYAAHLHGMYHIEFYQRIIEQLAPEKPGMMFSGIGGSVFEGDHLADIEINTAKDLYHLSFNHGLSCGDYLVDEETETEKTFFEKNKSLLQDQRFVSVFMMRMKLPLLSYLISVPAALGIPSAAPFLNFKIASSMLALPAERRRGRLWLKEFFATRDLNFERRSRYGDTRNTLNYFFFKNHTFCPLSGESWQSFVPLSAIHKINDRLQHTGNLFNNIRFFLTTQRIVKELLRWVGIVNLFNKDFNCWATLKAVEMSILKRRNR